MDSLPKFKKRKIFPIFFNVEPSDVRSQEGSFKEAFQDHENHVNPERVQRWRQALKVAGQLCGITLQNGDEEKFLRKIIKILRKMQNPQELCDVEHPVGIESRAQDIISALRLTDQTPSIVAVMGISGSGKTTIVKAVYDRISADFDVSCFIQDINSYEYRGRNWKVDLQKDVISYLTGNDKFPVMGSHNDGAGKIAKLINGRKVLLVLDDVYNYEQLKALSIHSASFGIGSRIIVTTVNKQSLGNLPYTIDHIRLLNTKESFKLFTGLTYGIDEPVDHKFVDEISVRAEGIPLVLEVWSRHFTYHERKQWPSVLEKLKKIPHEDLQKKFQMSFDSLTKKAKKLFLDIACFFVGMNKKLAIKVLQDEGSGFFPDIEIQYLVDKGLIKTDYFYTGLLLHHVIREMGQEVVRQENEDEPGHRTRLMDYTDVVRVLRACSGTDSVRTIKCISDFWEMRTQVTVHVEGFKKMSNLRFIWLDGYNIEWSSFSSNDDMSWFAFKHLKYLDWSHFPCKSLDNIDMGNVVVITLWNSRLEKLWDGVKSLEKLRILDVGWSSSLTNTGNFTALKNLEKLSLNNCKNLEELHSSVGCLQKLAYLDLSDCTELKRFPWVMIGKLTSLKKLDLCHCPNILKISHEVGSLKSLENLNLSKNTFYSLPDSLGQLHQLRKLNLSGCTNLKSIPSLPPSIEKIKASDCISLVNLPPNMSQLQLLNKLKLDNCSRLGSAGNFMKVTGLQNLSTFSMRNCNVSKVSSEIGNLVSLEYLYLSGNTFSVLPDSFNKLSKLRHFRIDDCHELNLLPVLPSNLNYIDAHWCPSLKVMTFDPMQNAYVFHSKVFKESFINGALLISLSEEDVPKWCSYQNIGDILSFVASMHLDNQICGVILCATIDLDIDEYFGLSPTMHNKTKETSHRFDQMEFVGSSMCVMFCPLDDTAFKVEEGDTLVLQFGDDDKVSSCGMRWVYKDDVLDSKLVITQLYDNEFCSSPSQDDECFFYDSFPSLPELLLL